MHARTHKHTPPGQVERAKDAWIAQKPSRGSLGPAVWNRGLREGITHWLQHTNTHTDARKDMYTHMHIHTHKLVLCSKLQIHSYTDTHKCTRTHVLPQMWNSGLREGITQTNTEQGKGSWESLERQQSHLSMARWWVEKRQSDGKETESTITLCLAGCYFSITSLLITWWLCLLASYMLHWMRLMDQSWDDWVMWDTNLNTQADTTHFWQKPQSASAPSFMVQKTNQKMTKQNLASVSLSTQTGWSVVSRAASPLLPQWWVDTREILTWWDG